MINKIKKYREIILYLFFGVCTTLINIISYIICTRVFNCNVVVSTVIAWFISVIFAYITNKIWVFCSENISGIGILKEILGFLSCRLFSGLLDLFIMWMCVDILNMQDMVIKIISNVIVIIFNYVASKCFIFKKEK